MSLGFSIARSLIWLLLFSTTMSLLTIFKKMEGMGFLQWFMIGTGALVTSYMITWLIFAGARRGG